jgi:hypothetical protein
VRGTSTSALGNGAMGVVGIGLLTAKDGSTTCCSCTVSVNTTICSGTNSGGTATLCSWTETGKVRRRSCTMAFAGGGTAGAVLEGGEKEEVEGT